MGWGSFDRGMRGRTGLRISYGSRRVGDATIGAWTRAALWLAVLLYGAHAGAAMYEILVVTPAWAADPPQSVRAWSTLTKAAIQPMAYQEPAILALGGVSLLVLWLSIWRTAARPWMVFSGALGVALVASTIIYAFPILERTLRDGGAGLTDQEIVNEVHAWHWWCQVRLVILLAAWASLQMALVRASVRHSGQSLLTSRQP